MGYARQTLYKKTTIKRKVGSTNGTKKRRIRKSKRSK